MLDKTRRIALNNILKTVTDNVYFQPPASVKMDYPCIVYSLYGSETLYANNERFHFQREYMITVMDIDPDSTMTHDILTIFKAKCSIQSHAIVKNINHTYLRLYY